MEKNTKFSAALQKILRSGVVSWAVIIAIWGLGSLAYDEYFLPSRWKPSAVWCGSHRTALSGQISLPASAA